VAFPQDGVLRAPGALDNLKRALAMGVDVVGGIPHFERTMADGAESVRILCELAAELGLPVDMHCDESDDPLSRHIETLAFHTRRLGCRGGWRAPTSRPCIPWTTTTFPSCCP
jgi:cytosine deaminase